MTREEAIDRLRKISEKTPIRTNGDDLVAITVAIQALSQEQKSGKWFDIPFSHYFKCSECDKYQISATNYCPICGAKMVEPQETETWNGMHGQITAPKGTFKKIYEDAEREDRE